VVLDVSLDRNDAVNAALLRAEPAVVIHLQRRSRNSGASVNVDKSFRSQTNKPAAHRGHGQSAP